MADAKEQFCAITGCDIAQAAQYLELGGGDLNTAISFFFEGNSQTGPLPTQGPVTPAPSKTINDLRGNEEQNQQNHQKIEELFKNAQSAGATNFDPSSLRDDPFVGTSSRLGEAGKQSQKVVVESKLPHRIVITFWQGCFTVNDGPPRKIDDPANQHFIDAINQQRVPHELLPANWTPEQEIDVELIDKKSEEWKPPPKDIKAFEGNAQKMGSSGPQGSMALARALVLDPTKASRSIKVWFADGVTQVVKVNEDHTLNDLRNHMEAIKPCHKPFTISLQSSGLVLSNFGQSVKDAGVIGAVVKQSV